MSINCYNYEDEIVFIFRLERSKIHTNFGAFFLFD